MLLLLLVRVRSFCSGVGSSRDWREFPVECLRDQLRRCATVAEALRRILCPSSWALAVWNPGRRRFSWGGES